MRRRVRFDLSVWRNAVEVRSERCPVSCPSGKRQFCGGAYGRRIVEIAGEKLLRRAREEARQVAAAAAKYGRVLQVGSQHLSDPRVAKAREIVQSGEIGELLWAQTTYSRNSVDGEWNYYIDEEATPKTIDWPRWLGPAPKRAFSAERYFQ